jgi:hypothetical protein
MMRSALTSVRVSAEARPRSNISGPIGWNKPAGASTCGALPGFSKTVQFSGALPVLLMVNDCVTV